MASSRRPRTERGAVDLLEQAVHLLRQAPIDALACYYVGALPFVLGALYFIADASRSAFAQQRLGASGAGLALLLVWMKCWQSAFTQMLLARVGGEAPPRWTSGRVVRLALVQAAVQPWGLFVLPLAEVALVPALWAYPFFQNVTVLGDGRAGQGIGPTVRAAWRQAGLWPRQNAHLALLLAIFGLFVFLNVAMALLVPAWVLKRFLGIDSVFMRGGFQVANTTFLGLTLGLTYLCLDPVAKTVYALRCFYGQSIHTGWDLRADLRHFLSARGAAAVVALVAAVLLCRPNAGLAAEATVPGAEPAPVVAPPEVPHEQLDESIARVIARREYAWRLPREQAPEGGTRSFLRSVAGWIQGRMDALARWLERREERDQQRQDSATRRRGESSWRGWAGAVRSVLYVLLVASAIVLATMLWVSLRRRPPKPAAAAASAAVAPADLDDESLSADRLPEEGWLDLAGQMLREGDYRRAVRAMFLASLAMLGRGGLVRLARYKSNHDYETELARRSHALPGLIGVFGQNVTCFEDVWYGMHEVSDGMVARFAANQERMRGLVQG